jgi:SNF2 family DNA or RNA helicase
LAVKLSTLENKFNVKGYKLVNYLASKGIDIVNKSSSLIDNEMYNILNEAFGDGSLGNLYPQLERHELDQLIACYEALVYAYEVHDVINGKLKIISTELADYEDEYPTYYVSIKDGRRKHEVVLIWDDEEVELECECSRYGDICIHAIKAVHHILEYHVIIYDEELGDLEGISASVKKPVASSVKPTAVSNHKKAINITSISEGVVQIRWSDDLKFENVFRKYLQKSYYGFHNGKIEYLWSSEDIFDIKNEGYYADEKYVLKVERVEEQILNFRCSICTKWKTDKFCDHTIKLLGLHDVFNVFSTWHFSHHLYPSLIAKVSKDVGLSQDSINKMYDITIINNKLVPRPKDGLVVSSKMPDFVLQASISDEEWLTKAVAMSEEVYPLLWSKDGELFILQGKQKSKAKGITGLKLVNTYNAIHDRDVFHFQSRYAKIDRNKGLDLFSLVNEHHDVVDRISHFFIDRKVNTYYSGNTFQRNELTEFVFSRQSCSILLYCKEYDDHYTLDIKYKLDDDGDQYDIMIRDMIGVGFIILDSVGYIFKSAEVAKFAAKVSSNQLYFKKSEQETFEKFVEEIGKFMPIHFEELQTQYISGGNMQIHIRELGKFVIFEPSCIFEDEYKVSLFGSSSIIDHSKKTKLEFDGQIFQDFKQWLFSLHSSWAHGFFSQGFLFLNGTELVENLWFLHFFEKAREFGIEVFGQEKLSNFKYSVHKASIKSKVKSGIDWFEASVDMKFGNISVDQNNWYDAIKNNEKYIKLSDGSIGILPEEWFKKLRRLVASSEKDGKNLKISKLKFYIIDQLFDEIDDKKVLAELETKKAALISYKENKKYKLPKKLTADLRPYQIEGYQWLKFCNEFNFGACLADDMGLGKTVQVISLLVDQKDLKQGTTLVVAPKSLLFNWAAELDKFAPSLSYHIYHGLGRDKSTEIYSEYDVLISTYDTVSRDIELFKAYMFNYIVLDESQAIKNINSMRYKAMRLLQSHHKIVMTGTPVENNTFDLYAQFSFINPGLLGSVKSFSDNFSTPIDTLGDGEKATLLKSMIHPFLMRRTKERVATDLPAKSESIIYCEMGTEQRKQYESLRKSIKEDVEATISTGGVNKSKFKILEGLLRLRQMCNSPEIIDSTLPLKKRESVKLQTLMEQLGDELGNHKALVFSQFVSMLDLIKGELNHRHIKYAYLDGSTVDRAKSVNDFMDNDECNVFLLSLKAGNAGLNLTKADYVYIVDPWWNPAVEAQAIDRTHRIGQSKNIFAYKLICKDTIEEKIVELQSKKKKLSEDLIQAEDNIFKSLNKDELLALFS